VAAECLVLLVDDQPIVAEALFRMVSDEPDIRLVACHDAAQALPKACEIRPTVILQDLVMPDVDGLTLVRYFRAHPDTTAIPIIVLSSKEDPVDKSRAFEVGASDYLVKLPSKIELLARVRAHYRMFLTRQERDEAYRALEVVKEQLELKNQELARLSSQDGLTALANRRRFDEVLDRECRRAKRERAPISLLLTDVDFFKRYNDTYGHQAGDECLRRIAAVLAHVARRPGDLAARYGGEEFAVILPNTAEDGAQVVAETVRKGVAALNLLHAASPVAPHVTLSVGSVTAGAESESSPGLLLELADAALYQSKREGRNRTSAAPFRAGSVSRQPPGAFESR
jgi:two-component system, chemotaxis family, response regulator WspR